MIARLIEKATVRSPGGVVHNTCMATVYRAKQREHRNITGYKERRLKRWLCGLTSRNCLRLLHARKSMKKSVMLSDFRVQRGKSQHSLAYVVGVSVLDAY